MPELLRMPVVAAGADEATLTAWPIGENQRYAATDVIANVETAKATVDVEAETDGVLIKILVPPGTDVQVGDPIALIARPGEAVEDVDAALTQLGVTQHGPAPRQPAVAPAGRPERIFASPLARRIAREAMLDVADLVGTGPNGRIVRRDVEGVIAARRPHPPAAAHAGSTDEARFEEIPHGRLRRAIATRMVQSTSTVPHFYLRGRARVDALLRLREELNDGGQVRISVNDLIVKAVARAHNAVPALNVSWTADALRRYQEVDLGIAVAIPEGLVTPVIRGVDRLSVSEVARRSRDLVERARAGRLRQHELEGGSATITNLGGYGTEEFAAIINPPQASILAVGATHREPVVTAKGRLKAATVLRVVLSVDHRAVDGAMAAEWMREFLAHVERPVRLLA